MFIHRRGNDDYLTGLAITPSKTDLKYKIWNAENGVVMSWVINSMTNKIGVDFMYYETTKEIQDATRESYNNKNTSQLFEVEGMIHDLQQGDLSVTQYFNTQNSFCQQLDIFNDSKVGCSKSSLKYKTVEEKERILKFMLGLTKNLDELRG